MQIHRRGPKPKLSKREAYGGLLGSIALAAVTGEPGVSRFVYLTLGDSLAASGLALSGAAIALVVYVLLRSRRGRLGKAFLLGSGGTPLKELVFDPRCTVSLVEALQALPDGGLALEQEGQRSGYGLRAFQGENLRLILAFQGRFAPELAAYAKFLLTSVGERLDKALAAREAAVVEGEERVAARATEVERRAASLSSEPELAERKQYIDGKIEDIRQLEEQFNVKASEADRERGQLQEWAKQVEEREEKLERWESKLERRENELPKREREIAEREWKATTIQEEARTRPEQAAREIQRLKDREEEIAKLRELLAKERSGTEESRKVSAGKMEEVEALERAQAEPKAREEALASSDEFEKRGRILAEREAVLNAREQELRSRIGDFEARERAAKGKFEEAEVVRKTADAAVASETEQQHEIEKSREFLQRKALEAVDREEKLRVRESRIQEQADLLDARANILDAKDRQLEMDRARLEQERRDLKEERERFEAERMAPEHAPTPGSQAEFEDWRKDLEGRIKILQQKSLDLLDREDKLRQRDEEVRKKEESLRELEARLEGAR